MAGKKHVLDYDQLLNLYVLLCLMLLKDVGIF